MDVQIAKWGNSLGLRIPKSFADALNLKDGKKARVRLDGRNRIVIEAADESVYEAFAAMGKDKNLAALLKSMTPYGPDETNDVAAVGNERFWDDE